MAALTAEQKQTVSQWAEEGATLNDIQSRLKQELGLSMTYMEARLLVMEMGLSLKDKNAKKPEEPAIAAEAQSPKTVEGEVVEAEFEGVEAEVYPLQDAVDEDFENGEVGEYGSGGATFAMQADELMVPGTLVSGSAVFSDGVRAKWSLDQMGRLSLRADQPGYQPPQADVPKFQAGLEKILIKMGLY